MNVTYINLLQIIEEFASKHLEIRRFRSDFLDQMQNFATAQNTVPILPPAGSLNPDAIQSIQSDSYPILYVSPANGNFNGELYSDYTKYTLNIYCVDLLQEDRANVNAILNTTSLIMQDLHTYFKNGEIPGVDLASASPLTPINNYLLDGAAGWSMSIQLNVNPYNVCDIPFSESPVLIDGTCDTMYQKWMGPQGPQGTAGTIGVDGAQGPQGRVGTTGAGGAIGFWGSFWDTTDQGATAANTINAITLNTSDPASNGVYISNGSRINFQHDGTYSMTFSIQFRNTDTKINDVNVWLRKNDTGSGNDVADSDTKLSVTEKHGNVDGFSLMTVNFVVQCSAGDFYEMMWTTTDTKVSIYTTAASTNPVSPRIPGVIFTATQVAYAIKGDQGWQGHQGRQGPQGLIGYQGNAGTNGDRGFQGWQGPQGIAGTNGTNGAQGVQGVQGVQGRQGFQGVQGRQGFQGFQGAQGVQGRQGVQGWQGPIGTGTTGPQGPAGTGGGAAITGPVDVLPKYASPTGLTSSIYSEAFGSAYVGNVGTWNGMVFRGDLLLETGTAAMTIGFGPSYPTEYTNTVLGVGAMGGADSTPNNSIAIGYNTMSNGAGGQGKNIAIGPYALWIQDTGGDNIGIGYESQYAGVSTWNNLSFGHSSLRFNYTGSSNLTIGNYAMYYNTSGYGNLTIGHNSGMQLETGKYNTIIGISNITYPDMNTAITAGEFILSIAKGDTYSIEDVGYNAPHIWANAPFKITNNENPVEYFDAWTYSGAFIEYVIEDALGNLRAGTIQAVWNQAGSEISWTDTVTNTLGAMDDSILHSMVAEPMPSHRVYLNLLNPTATEVAVSISCRLITRVYRTF